MARTRSSRGKEREEDAGDSAVENVKQLLPERLFATDRFPSERTNIYYSTSDFLLRVRDALKGSPEMLVLLSSCFGGLFNIPARNLYAGWVVHSMMTRQLPETDENYMYWEELIGNNRDVLVEDLLASYRTSPHLCAWTHVYALKYMDTYVYVDVVIYCARVQYLIVH
ncbi:Uncharacterized protein Rs2_51865 [Raphanus sativus]|nr:Uncharacterized protein Rs2_51865 [Raphanus sativus]